MLGRRGRAGLALAVVAVLSWLVVSRGPDERRADRITAALDAGLVGGLGQAEQARLRRALPWLLQAAGISVPFALNEPYRPGRFHFYTTTPAAQAATRCGAGNAVYDRELDAVFMDTSFFGVAGYQSIFEASSYSAVLSMNDDLVFPEVYRWFVILHELGHRQRHGRRLALGQPTDDRIEREADAFALTALRRFYDAAQSAEPPLLGPPVRAAIGSEFFGPDTDSKHRADVDLVGTLYLISTMALFLDTPFSPFFRSPTHPMFLDRARNAITTVLAAPDLHPRLRLSFEFLRESLARQAAVSALRPAEVLVPEPIVEVAFDPTGLVTLTRSGQRIYRWDRPITRSSTEPPLMSFATPIPVTGPRPEWKNKALWSRASGALVWVDDTGQPRVLRAGSWVPEQAADPRACKYYPAGSPSNRVLVMTCAQKTGDTLTVLDGATSLIARTMVDIREELLRLLRDPSLTVGVHSATEHSVYVTVEDLHGRDPSLLAVAELDISTLRLRAVHRTAAQPPGRAGLDAGVRVVAGEPKGVFVFNGTGRNAVELTAWHLVGDAAPRRVGTHEHLVNRVGDVSPDIIADFDPYFVAARPLATVGAVVAYGGDSAYLVDVRRNAVSVMFHPAFEGLKIATSPKGETAFYVSGGHRIFVFDTPESLARPSSTDPSRTNHPR